MGGKTRSVCTPKKIKDGAYQAFWDMLGPISENLGEGEGTGEEDDQGELMFGGDSEYMKYHHWILPRIQMEVDRRHRRVRHKREAGEGKVRRPNRGGESEPEQRFAGHRRSPRHQHKYATMTGANRGRSECGKNPYGEQEGYESMTTPTRDTVKIDAEGDVEVDSDGEF